MTGPSRPLTLLDKSEILDGLFSSWDDLDRLMTGLPEECWLTPTPLPGWCVHDVIAHVIGTESMLSGVATPESDVDVAKLDHVRNAIGEMNECWARHLRGESAADVLERFRDVTAARRAMLTNMIDEAWNAPTMTPAGPDSYGRFMRIRIFDCWMHEQDIRHALARPSSDADLEGPTARLALDEMAGSMGFVVGKLGKAPDGARVAIELTGPLARTIRVAVDGRASLVADFGGAEPTVVIGLDGLQFTRLCGGRPMTTARPTDIVIERRRRGGPANSRQLRVRDLTGTI